MTCILLAVGKAKFAITKDQTLHLKEGKDHTVHHFDYLVPTESLAMPLLGPERMSDALGLKRGKLFVSYFVSFLGPYPLSLHSSSLRG